MSFKNCNVFLYRFYHALVHVILYLSIKNDFKKRLKNKNIHRDKKKINSTQHLKY